MSGLFAAVEKFVEENGPITGREIYGNIPYSDGSIRVALSYLRRTKKSIHISGWIWEEYGHLIRALAQYSPGPAKMSRSPPRVPRRSIGADTKTRSVLGCPVFLN